MGNPRLTLVAMLLVAALALLPFGRMVEIPMGFLSLLGVVLLTRASAFAAGAPWRRLVVLYLLFVTPMILALVDAVALEKASLSTIGSLRYPFSCAALLALYALSHDAERTQRRLLAVIAYAVTVLLGLWCFDGLLQAVTGRNTLGYGVGEGYINGLFGDDDNIKFGLTLALLMPVAVVTTLRNWSTTASLAYVVLLLTLVALSGKRAAWIVAAVELAVLLVYYHGRGYLAPRRVSAFALAAVMALLVAYGGSDWVRQRSDVLVEAVEHPDYETLNRASGKRLPIWGTALRMFSDNPLNGVGPRGFRYAYADYASADDHWAKPLAGSAGSRGSHAHQLMLDLGSETGVFGLLGYALLVGVLLQAWRRASAAARSRALPYGVALTGMLFPINTHPAWYSSWSSLMLWFFIGLYLFALAETSAHETETADTKNL